jgi:hypothetical protein
LDDLNLPSVQCVDAGLLKIEAQTLPRTRAVRLHLSTGRQITTRVAIVPAKLGGPAGFYYQVVPGPLPIPVTLTELDAHGTVLRSVRLPSTVKCAQQSLQFLPLGNRTIAHGSLPQGPSFSIVDERYSLRGKIHFYLHVAVVAEEEGRGAIGGAGSMAVGEGIKLQTGCQPYEYAILYGFLNTSSDRVLTRSSDGFQPLRQVHIPAGLHVH